MSPKKSYFGFGKRIDEIQVSFPGQEVFTKESFFLESDTIIGSFNFKLVNGTGGTAAFSTRFSADVVTLPESSFIHWLTNKLAKKDNMADGVSIDGERIVFAPTLDKTPPGFRQKKLGSPSRNPKTFGFMAHAELLL